MPTIFTNLKLHPRASRVLRLALQALAALLVSVLVAIAAAPAHARTLPIDEPAAGLASGTRR